MPNRIPGEYLGNIIISICKDFGVEIDSKDIEGCHRLPHARDVRGQDKIMIVKFVSWKHSEALLRDKKWISSKSFNHLNLPNEVFDSVSLCPYYKYIRGKRKDLQGKGQVDRVFFV